MARLNINIHENLVLTAPKLNEKGGLELPFQSVSSEEDMLAAMENDEVYTQDSGSILLFPVKATSWDGKPLTAAEVGSQLSFLKHQLSQLSLVWGSKEVVKEAIGGLAMFKNLVDPSALSGALNNLTNPNFLESVNKNLFQRFIDLHTQNNGANAAMRLKLVRQSKNKPFPTLSRSTFDKWCEPMSVTSEQSQIKWTDAEIKSGINSNAPAAASTTDQGENNAAKEKAAALFGGAPTTTATEEAPSLSGSIPGIPTSAPSLG